MPGSVHTETPISLLRRDGAKESQKGGFSVNRGDARRTDGPSLSCNSPSIPENTSLITRTEVPRSSLTLNLPLSNNGADGLQSHSVSRQTARHTARSISSLQALSPRSPGWPYSFPKTPENEAILRHPDRALLTHLQLEKKLLEMQIDFLQQTKCSIPETVAFKVSTAKANDEANERHILARYLHALQKVKLQHDSDRKNADRDEKEKLHLNSSSELFGEPKRERQKKAGVSSGAGGVGRCKLSTSFSISSAEHGHGTPLRSGKKVETGKKGKSTTDNNTTVPTPASETLIRLENEMREYVENAQRRKEELDEILGELKSAVKAFFPSFSMKETQGVT